MSRPRLLLVSLGAIGRRHLRNARALVPDAEIAVLRRPESAGSRTPGRCRSTVHRHRRGRRLCA